VPLYEYRCRTCDETFERRRPMSESSAPAECSAGHVDSIRLLSVFASTGGAAAGSSSAATSGAPRSGGVCGSGCGCHH
jgi:putative FmdB family regulatory protein